MRRSLAGRGGLADFGRKADRLVAAVEDDELRAEHDVAVDLQVGARVALYAAETRLVLRVDGRERHGVARHVGHVRVADGDAKVGKLRAAWVREAAGLLVQASALDLGVVLAGDVVVDEEQRGAGV